MLGIVYRISGLIKRARIQLFYHASLFWTEVSPENMFIVPMVQSEQQSKIILYVTVQPYAAVET